MVVSYCHCIRTTDKQFGTVGGNPFTIIADETRDVSNREQLCLAVRYVDETGDEPAIVERFLRFEQVAGLTGKFTQVASFWSLLINLGVQFLAMS